MSTESFEHWLFSNYFISLHAVVTALICASLCPGDLGAINGLGAVAITFLAVWRLPNLDISTSLHERAHTYVARMLGFKATYTIDPPVSTTYGRQKPWQASLISLAPLSLAILGATVAYTALLLDIALFLKAPIVFIGTFVWLAGHPSGVSPTGDLPDWEVAIKRGARGINYAVVVAQSVVPISLATVLAWHYAEL